MENLHKRIKLLLLLIIMIKRYRLKNKYRILMKIKLKMILNNLYNWIMIWKWNNINLNSLDLMNLKMLI